MPPPPWRRPTSGACSGSTGFAALIDDPVAVLADVYGWGSPDFDWDELLVRLGVFLDRVSTFAFVQPGEPPFLRVAFVGHRRDRRCGAGRAGGAAGRSAEGLDGTLPLGDRAALTATRGRARSSSALPSSCCRPPTYARAAGERGRGQAAFRRQRGRRIADRRPRHARRLARRGAHAARRGRRRPDLGPGRGTRRRRARARGGARGRQGRPEPGRRRRLPGLGPAPRPAGARRRSARPLVLGDRPAPAGRRRAADDAGRPPAGSARSGSRRSTWASPRRPTR